MLVGIISDSHDAIEPTKRAVEILQQHGVKMLFHCGDIIDDPIIEICAKIPLQFVFGNHDSDMTRILENAATKYSATCLGWSGIVHLAGKTIGLVHGHLSSDLLPLLDQRPDYIFSGHFHEKRDWHVGQTRRIIPGALFRAETLSVATLDLATDTLTFIDVPESAG